MGVPRLVGGEASRSRRESRILWKEALLWRDLGLEWVLGTMKPVL